MRSILVLVLLLAGSTGHAADAVVSFACCSYNPPTVTIAPGESVTWNGSFTSHPLLQVDGPTSNTGVPGGFSAASGSTFTQSFNTPGTYHYHCTVHGTSPTGMRGTVIVLDNLFANGFEGN